MTTLSRPTTACVSTPEVFLHPLLEESLPAGTTSDLRRRQAQLAGKAEAACLSCPLLADCLYDAVVRHDVNGFVAGTTQRQRIEIRQALRITVEPEDFDTLAGVSARNRQVDHDEVLRLRNANPHESLEMIAQRLGCSLSTVKRHLRKARQGHSPATLTVVPPSREQVMQAYFTITTGRSRRRAA
jgi:AraC-like DNA-binding protein